MRLSLFSFLALLGASFAQEFPPPYNSERETTPLSTPQEALAAIELPPGFQATLFAAEPDVRNPIAMAWDERGRMWVAENYTYSEHTKRFELALMDRVIILEDKDWDGRAETRTVFTDDVQMLTGIEVGRGGVWLMCPPRLLFLPNRDGDDKPDGPAEVVLDGFTVARDNYHNFANGLRWAPDGWLYGRCGHSCPGRLGAPGTPDEKRVPIKGGLWRWHPERKIVEVLTHGTTNPWGHDWDANGEGFFINTVTGHLWHLIHGAHLADANPSPNPFIYERLDTIADHWHFDHTKGRAELHGGKAGQMGGGHAHVGMMIYLADQWPEPYRGKLFTLNMHGRRANVERLERRGSGYVGRHEPDVFRSRDPWFRGIEISAGPDGSGFVLDWADIGECHEFTGVHRTSGRIYRLSHGSPAKPARPFAWKRPWPKPDLASPDEHARALAIREAVQFWPLDGITGPMKTATYPDEPALLAKFISMSRADASGLVRLNLASVLQRLPVDKRAPLAAALAARAEDANDQNLPLMVWFGVSPLAETNPRALVEVAQASAWPKLLRFIARSVATKPEVLDALLSDNRDLEPLLAGLAEGLRGLRKAPKPPVWESIAAKHASHPLVRELSALFGDGRALDDMRLTALDENADITERRAALRSLIEARPDDLREVCRKLLPTRHVNLEAARGLALFDDEETAATLARAYRQVHFEDRPALLGLLVSRPVFAKALLQEMARGSIPRGDLTAFHARQITALNDAELSRQLAETWGEMREAAADKRELIAKHKSTLTLDVLARADLAHGRALFTSLCSACHALYGQGGQAGPDLTGSGRANLDYLLENIVDPSAVVSADFRLQLITMKDGRTLGGLITQSGQDTFTLRTLTESQTLARADVAKQESSPLSMMPEGLLSALPPEHVRDLMGYLMHPVQVQFPGEAKPAKTLRAGMIGLDTSHVPAFTRVFNEAKPESELAGIKIVAGYPGGTDMPASRDRVAKFTEQVRGMGVEICETIPKLLERVDVVLLESVDGRIHLKEAREAIKAGKPVFIDKPVAGSLADAVAIFELAKKHNVPCFSSSSYRFGDDLRRLSGDEAGGVNGATVWSSLSYQEGTPDMFFYGVHGIEALFTIMGSGCETVSRVKGPRLDQVTGVWKDDRLGTYRGIVQGNASYGAVVHGGKAILHSDKPGSYEGLCLAIARFFRTGQPPVSAEETLEIFAFMEAADESQRQGGKPVPLAEVLANAKAEAAKSVE